MKKSVTYLLLFIPFLVLSCSKSDDDGVQDTEVYTKSQEQTFDVLKGSFQHITKIIDDVEVKGEILTFEKRFEKPKEMSGYVVHGEGTSEDVIGKGLLSYDFYYFVSKGGLGLKIYRKKDSGSTPFKDCTLSFDGRDKFTLFYSSSLPGGGMDTFYRIK